VAAVAAVITSASNPKLRLIAACSTQTAAQKEGLFVVGEDRQAAGDAGSSRSNCCAPADVERSPGEGLGDGTSPRVMGSPPASPAWVGLSRSPYGRGRPGQPEDDPAHRRFRRLGRPSPGCRSDGAGCPRSAGALRIHSPLSTAGRHPNRTRFHGGVLPSSSRAFRSPVLGAERRASPTTSSPGRDLHDPSCARRRVAERSDRRRDRAHEHRRRR
jgi:hypothetical protein